MERRAMPRLFSALRRLFSVTPDDRVSDETLRHYARLEMRQGWVENYTRWHSPRELRAMRRQASRESGSGLRMVGGRR